MDITNTTVAADQVHDPASETEKTTPSGRRSRGIEHNSRNDEDITSVSAETFSTYVADIDRAIRTVDDVEIETEQSKLPSSYSALALLFALLIRVTALVPLPRFFAIMGIDAHGNAKNPVQPAVAWFWRNYEGGYVRQTVWRWSAVLAVALESKISVEEFPSWVATNGIEKLVRTYQQAASRSKTEADIAAEEAIAGRVCAHGDDAPVMPATRVTVGKDPGRRLAIIDVLPEGGFRVLTVLPAGPDQIRKMLVSEARKRAARGV